MAKKGEPLPDPVSQAQYDYYLKQAKSVMPKTDRHHNPITDEGGNIVFQTTPLDSRGQAHRASRNEQGKVTKPGGGEADGTPNAKQAMGALLRFHNAGKTKEQLPEKSTTPNALRKDDEHNKMKDNKIIKFAQSPPGTRELAKQSKRLAASKQYTSNFISEEFNFELNRAFGIL